MKARKKFLGYLLISFLSFIGLLLFINTFDPFEPIDLVFLKIPPQFPFFILVFLTIIGMSSFILKSGRRALLVSLLATVFLLLQYLHYNNIFYTAILIVIAVLLEIFFWKKK